MPEELALKMATMSATELVAHLQRGEITSVQALLYFAAMAAESHKRYNCLTDVMFPGALARAEELDKILKETGRPVGPLHGLPISIKECISVKGTHASAGLVYFLDKVCEDDAPVVKLLKNAGAVLYVKTNIPQTMLISDCGNQIYGQTLNPFNSERTSGGSSGGEGALVSSGGSPLGIGTDIGGSIRMPASWCGICGVMPSPGRFTREALAPEVFPGIETVIATCGPIVRAPEDAALIYRVISGSDLHDADRLTPPLPFDEEKYKSTKPLVIGYYVDDGHFTPSTAAKRAVMEAVDALKAKGHTLVQFQPHNVLEAISWFFTFMTGDGEFNLRPILQRETIDPCIVDVWQGMTAPWLLRYVARGVFKFIGWPRLANIISIWSGSAEYEHKTVSLRARYVRELVSRMRAAELDAIVCPGPAIPAPRHRQSQLMTTALAYTYFWNVVRFPAASMAVTTVKPDDLKQPSRPAVDLTDRIANQNDIGSEGLPVAVQIASYPWNDETIMRVTNDLAHLQPDASPKLRISMTQALLNGSC